MQSMNSMGASASDRFTAPPSSNSRRDSVDGRSLDVELLCQRSENEGCGGADVERQKRAELDVSRGLIDEDQEGPSTNQACGHEPIRNALRVVRKPFVETLADSVPLQEFRDRTSKQAKHDETATAALHGRPRCFVRATCSRRPVRQPGSRAHWLAWTAADRWCARRAPSSCVGRTGVLVAGARRSHWVVGRRWLFPARS